MCACLRCHVAKPPRHCACSPRHPPVRWSAPTSSATSPGPCCSTMSNSPPTRSSVWPAKPGRWCSRAASGLRSTASIWRRLPPRWRNGPASANSPVPRSCVRASDSTGRVCPVVSRCRAAVGRWTSSAAPPTRRPPPSCNPKGSSASFAPTRPRLSAGCGSSTHHHSVVASHSTWVWGRRPPCWPTWHVTPVTAPCWWWHLPPSWATGPPRPHASHPASRCSCTTVPTAPKSTSSRARSSVPTSSSLPTPRRCATWMRSRPSSGHVSCSTRHRRSRTPPATRRWNYAE
ncbi:unannotated protein [freshwater metagenome]|uniref:Unannotated protein n=1 Tax=freshwater metagenome TaxID=449393 RepID=A0A6J7APK9_9ZZZZ